ncbi:MAG TPA: glycosyltransferase [Pseudonocardiaceae bacterium]|nr:glycosyltransferase [Pseudonocardiaceae bacterium]
MTRTDVVFTFPVETMFDDAVKREFCRSPDQMLLTLARDDRVGTLLAADAWRSLPISLARRRPYRLSEPITIAGRPAVRVRPHRLRRADSTDLGRVEVAYRAYAQRLGTALARSRGEPTPGPGSAALITYHPFVAAFCAAAWIRNVVYVGQDDWATGDPLRPWWELYREAYRRIDERRAAIFAVSAELASRISPRGVVAANGVSAQVWNPRRPAPPRIEALARPRAIYAGTIDDRLDRGLVERTARAVGSFVLIGHPGDANTIRWLRSVEGIHVFGTVSQQKLAATIQACDVGVLPHRDHPCTRAMSPLKLYEYLAAGLPVVSVDLPPVHGVDDRVLICGREDWPMTLQRALATGRASETRRLRFIADASWEKRLRPVVEATVS